MHNACHVISNKPRFRLKHPGDPDSSDNSGRTLYRLTENQRGRVAQTIGRVKYLSCGSYFNMPLVIATRRIVYYPRRSGVSLPLLWVRNVVMSMHHWNDTYVTLFTGVAAMQ